MRDRALQHPQALRRRTGGRYVVTPYEAFLFIYEYLKFGKTDEAMREKLYHYASCWNFRNQKTFSTGEEAVYRALCFIFLLLGDYHQLLLFTSRLFEQHPSILFNRTDPFRLMMLCWKAQAHLSTGDIHAARRISCHVDSVLKHYPAEFYNGKHLETLQKIIAAQIHLHDQEFNKAIRAAESAMEMAHKLDFKIFALLNYSILDRIYHHLKMDKQKKDAQQKMIVIRQSTTFIQTLPGLVEH